MKFQVSPTVAPGLTEAEAALFNRLYKKLERFAIRNAERTAYYDHEKTAKAMGLNLRAAEAANLRHTLGWCAKAVDSISLRTVCEGLVVPGHDLGEYDLDLYWKENRLAIESAQAQTSAYIHGVAFLVTTRGGEGEPAVLTTAKDALSGTGDYNVRTRRMDNFFSLIRLCKDKGIGEVVLYLPGENITLSRSSGESTYKVTRTKSGLPFVPVEALIYNGRTGRPLGSSRITATAMNLLDGALRTMLRSEINAEEFINPIRALMNYDPEQFTDEDGNPNAAFYALQNSRTVMLEAGKLSLEGENGIHEVQTTPKFEMLQGMDMTPHQVHLAMWAAQFSAETNIPMEQLGVQSVGQPVSAEAINAHNSNLILEAERAARSFESAYTASAQTAWMLMNNTTELPDDLRRMSTVFRDPNTPSRGALADAVMKEVQAGVLPATSDVALERLGYSSTQIERIKRDRANELASTALSSFLTGDAA